MATLINNPESFFRKLLGKKRRVLLINPPVEERRYHWIRWNQPTDLLRLSSWLRTRDNTEVRLFDFMFPDEVGAVPKHKVKESWTGSAADEQLWHFGQPFEVFERFFNTVLFTEGWVPDVIVVTSLTSYWHRSIQKLLTKICARIGKAHRKHVTICLYGNYPRFEPEHAASQDADVALTATVNTTGYFPDFALYQAAHKRLPPFFALDIEDEDVGEHLKACLDLQTAAQRDRSSRPATITATFFNDDVCSAGSKISNVITFADSYPSKLFVEGICGIRPESLSTVNLEKLHQARFQTLFVEHARKPGGEVDAPKYAPLLEHLRRMSHAKKSGEGQHPWLRPGNVTGFVAMGLPDDNMDSLVRATLLVNTFFQAVILKPFGYSPSFDPANAVERRRRWKEPRLSSAQMFPYVGNGSALSVGDYDNLVRWQSLLNKRVKGTTFDFLSEGNVPRLARETLIAESWKRRKEGQ
jgi:hypothetical protein